MRWVNPLGRRLIARGIGGAELLVLHFTGRRSGRRFDVPAGYRMIDGAVCVFTDGRWRHNFAGGRDVEVTLSGQRRPMRAFLYSDPDTVAQVYTRLIDEHGLVWARRHLGMRMTVRRPPTREELREMIARSGLSIIRLEARPS